MKCRWKHCRYGGEVDKEEAIKIGNLYYHKDCYNEKQTINKIIELYRERVDPNPVESWLRKSINDIVYKNGCSAQFLLYAFKYCLNSGWTIYNPGVLKAVSKNIDAKIAWDKEQNNIIRQSIKEQQKALLDSNFMFDLPNNNQTYKNDKPNFKNVLGV